MKDQTENLENIGTNFDKMDDKMSFIREEITKIEKIQNVNFNFNECHVSICKNGGLIGLCKKKGFLDIEKGSLLNNNIIVMFQDGSNVIQIPILWDYKKRWVVCFDFNDKEQLYAICNDGTIYKIDILTKEAIEKPKSRKFEEENIDKAILFEKGFIALTTVGTFYLVKDIKDPLPIVFFHMGGLLQFSNNVKFIAIPSSHSKSGKVELLFTNEKGDGIIRVEEPSEGENFGMVPGKDGSMEIKGVDILTTDRLESYKVSSSNTTQINSMGKIDALAISPSNKQIALYNAKRQTVYFFHVTLDENLERYKKMSAKMQVNMELTEAEISEQKAVLCEFNQYSQFLFVGEDAVAVSGQRFISIINTLNKTLVYKITEKGEFEAMTGRNFCKCISEVDGLRYFSSDGVYLIRRVPPSLLAVCDIFLNSPGKKLLSAFRDASSHRASCDREIRELGARLPEAIGELLMASAEIFWRENEDNKDENNEMRDVQMFLMKAAQHGKSFVEKEDFNFNNFVDTCKDIRIVNNLRNNKRPRLITFDEYKKMLMKDIIAKTIRQYNFALAFSISKYIGFDEKIVFDKYAIAKIKNLKTKTEGAETNLLKEITKKLKGVQNISYIQLAKKSYKYGHAKLGAEFLKNEKSLLTKIPEYIRQGSWEEALKLSFETFDSNVLMTVIDKIFRSVALSEFINLVGKYSKATSATVDYLRKNGFEQELQQFLQGQKNHEQIFFLTLENFFKTKDVQKRKKLIELARIYEKDQESNSNFDYKFYRSYLDDLEHSLEFKEELIKTDVIKKTDISSFDNSIYDCFKMGVKLEKYPAMERLNNKYFGLPLKKMSILRIRSYAEMGKFNAIEALIAKTTLKKLCLSPLNVAEVYIEFKQTENAVKYLKMIQEPEYFDYKIEMLKSLERYADALEAAIAGKNNYNVETIVSDILIKRPDLRNRAIELNEKYRAGLKI